MSVIEAAAIYLIGVLAGVLVGGAIVEQRQQRRELERLAEEIARGEDDDADPADWWKRDEPEPS